MNRLLYFSLFLILFFSCKKDKSSNSSSPLKQTETSTVAKEDEQKPKSSTTKAYKKEIETYDTGLNQPIDSISKKFKIKELDHIDSEQKFKESKVLKAYSWSDSNGENKLIITRKGPFSGTESGFTSSLYAVQYLNGMKKENILWDIYDFEKDCQFDLWIGLVPNSIRITDLDNDGVSETTFIYKKNCRSDVSPAEMKLMMHENAQKMALRGWMALPIFEESMENLKQPNFSKVNKKDMDEMTLLVNEFGRYQNENDFAKQPPAFVDFARKHWVKNAPKDEFLQF